MPVDPKTPHIEVVSISKPLENIEVFGDFVVQSESAPERVPIASGAFDKSTTELSETNSMINKSILLRPQSDKASMDLGGQEHEKQLAKVTIFLFMAGKPVTIFSTIEELEFRAANSNDKIEIGACKAAIRHLQKTLSVRIAELDKKLKSD